MRSVRLGFCYAVIAGLFFLNSNCFAGFMDNVKGTLSEATTATKEAAGDVADSAKSVGQDMGFVKKEVATPAAKLPGGVTSRIRKMNKELDNVEKKLTTGAGNQVDRAKRAELDLKRAQNYMDEIESRYKGQYSAEHPDMVAAIERLETATTNWKKAMNQAETETAEAIRLEKEQRLAEEARQAEVAKTQLEERQLEEAARQSAEASCDEWSKKFEIYMSGEKGLMAYATDDMGLVAKWRILYQEAEETLNEYPAGLCSRADGVAQYVRTKVAEFKEMDKNIKAELAAAKADMGGFVFNDSPFSGPKDNASKTSFNTGENIYGMIKLQKPLSEIYGQKSNFMVRIDVKIDGKAIHSQFVTVKSADYGARNYLIFNVAPKLKDLIAYSDDNIAYGKSTATTIQGPNELTHHLGALSPGKHTFSFGMYYYGKTWAEGSFTVNGQNYKDYAKLHEKIAKGVIAARTIPPAQMENKGLEKQMTALLKNAGWESVYRLNIVDKDWWIERVDGGNTAVKSRYLAAVAMAKKSDGSYFYKKCTFHQDKLITGAFGELYLSHQGDEVPISKENRDK